jgi:hypothetical protein
MLEQSDYELKPGDKVVGTVYECDEDGAYVEIGAKSAGFVPLSECSLARLKSVRGPADSLKFAPPRAAPPSPARPAPNAMRAPAAKAGAQAAAGARAGLAGVCVQVCRVRAARRRWWHCRARAGSPAPTPSPAPPSAIAAPGGAAPGHAPRVRGGGARG